MSWFFSKFQEIKNLNLKTRYLTKHFLFSRHKLQRKKNPYSVVIETCPFASWKQLQSSLGSPAQTKKTTKPTTNKKCTDHHLVQKAALIIDNFYTPVRSKGKHDALTGMISFKAPHDPVTWLLLPLTWPRLTLNPFKRPTTMINVVVPVFSEHQCGSDGKQIHLTFYSEHCQQLKCSLTVCPSDVTRYRTQRDMLLNDKPIMGKMCPYRG